MLAHAGAKASYTTLNTLYNDKQTEAALPTTTCRSVESEMAVIGSLAAAQAAVVHDRTDHNQPK